MADYGSLPFAEQIAFFREKHPVLTAAWTDVYAAEHDHAFMVAGAAKADLLADLRAAVEKGIAEGGTIEHFRKDFDALVERHGWSYEGGRNWRARVIYETNLRQSYHAGREAQMADPALRRRRPYGLYRHGGSAEPRPEHLAWDGLVLPLDDPWWDTHTPQNGWGCKCKKFMVNARDVERMGLKVGSAPPVEWEEKVIGVRGPSPRTVKVPKGIDPGFEYRPGATRAADLMSKTRVWPVDVAATFAEGLSDGNRAEIVKDFAAFVDDTLTAGRAAGRRITVAAIGPAELAWLQKEKGVVPLRADISLEDRLIIGKKARRHEAVGDALTTEEWRALPRLEREAVLYDNETGNVLYVLTPLADDPRKVKAVVALDYRAKGKDAANSVRSVFKVGKEALLDRRRYEVIDGAVEK